MSKAEPGAAGPSETDILDAYSRAVIGVVERIGPAVIAVTGRENAGGDEPRGSGSGVVIAPDGLALTNSHVVAGRTRLRAVTHEGDRLDADVLGDDPATDLALLRVASRSLPSAAVGRSRELRVGQLVVAVGNPFGLQSTVSTGVVSALGRGLRGRDGRMIEDVVQHTAPLNPGNSGGPLVDSRGRIVGINTAVIAYSQGLGFAVPAETANWVVSELLAHGRVRRARLGIAAGVVEVTRALARRLDLLNQTAVQVREVEAAGRGAKAGVREGDLIVAVGDVHGPLIQSIDDLHRVLNRAGAGMPVDLVVAREGRLLTVRIEP